MEDMRERFTATVTALLDDDPRLALVLADISAQQFGPAAARHPERVLNVGIREQLLVGVAGGLALEGFRPIAHSYAPFLVERAFEQVKLDIGHQGTGAVLVSVGASYDWPAGGRTHQAPGDVALLDTLPGWAVHVPAHADDVDALLREAVRHDGPVYLRLSATPASAPHSAPGGGFTVLRAGARGSVLVVGPLVDRVLAAVEGLDVTVLHAVTVRPFDAWTLRATLHAPDVVLVEPYLAGTSAWAVADALRDAPHRLLSLGVRRDAEVRRYGDVEDHDRVHGLDARSLRKRIAEFVGR
ncbi:MAG: transketolase [Actinomycetota bacterium]|nr:transketolase [Actinomycetota bacterium]